MCRRRYRRWLWRRCLPVLLAPGLLAEAAEPDPPAPTEADAQTLSVEEVLANPLGDGDYAESRRCLSTSRYRRIEIVTDQALAFVGRGDTVWLNQLPHRCHGLRRDMVLVVEQSSMRVCARDRVRGLARASTAVGTATCPLGAFRPLPRENFDAMRDALVAAHRNRTVARTKRSAPGDDG